MRLLFEKWVLLLVLCCVCDRQLLYLHDDAFSLYFFFFHQCFLRHWRTITHASLEGGGGMAIRPAVVCCSRITAHVEEEQEEEEEDDV